MWLQHCGLCLLADVKCLQLHLVQPCCTTTYQVTLEGAAPRVQHKEGSLDQAALKQLYTAPTYGGVCVPTPEMIPSSTSMTSNKAHENMHAPKMISVSLDSTINRHKNQHLPKCLAQQWEPLPLGHPKNPDGHQV